MLPLTSLALLAVGAVLLGYTATRASLLTFTHDESFSYVYHARASVEEILSFTIRRAPSNNHLLNTLLMKLSAGLFGESELALRLPNLLAHALYLVTAGLIARRFGRPPVILAAFLVLSLNPFILDYFSVARGYGLGLGFMLGSLYFCLRCFEAPKVSSLQAGLTAAFAALAVLSTFSFLHVYVALNATVVALILARAWRARRAGVGIGTVAGVAARSALPLMLVGAILAALVAGPIRNLREWDELYAGGTIGFWQDTVGSLIRASLYGQPYAPTLAPLLAVLVGVVLAVNAGLFARFLVRGGQRCSSALTLTIVPTAVVCTLTSSVQGHLLGIPFLEGRTAILFLPLFALLLLNAVRAAIASDQRWFSVAARALLVLIATGVALHAIRTADLRVVGPIDPYNVDTLQMLADLEADRRSSRDGDRVRLGASVVFEPTINFYRITRRLSWLREVTRAPLGGEYDYYFATPDDVPALDGRPRVTIRQYPDTGNVLARRTRG